MNVRNTILGVSFVVVTIAAAIVLINRLSNETVSDNFSEVWAPIELFLDKDRIWHDSIERVIESDISQEEKDRQFETLREARPSAEAAVTAALSIVQSGSQNRHTLPAADFLLEKTSGSSRRAEAMVAAMMTRALYDPDYEEWQKAMLIADVYTPPGYYDELDQFFEKFSTHVSDRPVAQATARYYAATRRMTLANQAGNYGNDQENHRQIALDFAEGMSAGVENEELVRRQPPGDDGEKLPYPTFEQAEKDLLFLLNFLTVGQVVPDGEANTVDGVSDRLSHYRGKTLLLDFWATWCAPCIESLPKLDELKAILPNSEFEVISINTDESIDELTDFISERPMPWVHWYIGENAKLLRTWAIRGFPTYLLIDDDGVLIAKQHGLDDEFIDLIKTTACALGETCTIDSLGK